MSKYTTEVRYICEKANDLEHSTGYLDVDDIIEGAIPDVFSFTFPIFDQAYRNVLCTKILRHYYTREIGFETVGLWKLKLQTKLNEIMPFYNQLYKSELINFNPLYDTDLQTTNVGNKDSETNKQESRTGNAVAANQKAGSNTTDSTSTNTGTAKSSDTTESERNANAAATDNNLHYDLYSDTPQGGLTGVDSETYLTNARKITDAANKTNTEFGADKSASQSESETSGFGKDNTKNDYNETGSETRTNTENAIGKDTFTSTENYLIHVVGKQGGQSFSKMLQEYRDTFLNIDMEIIENLSELFISLW